jgi:acetyl esterase/lipase
VVHPFQRIMKYLSVLLVISVFFFSCKDDETPPPPPPGPEAAQTLLNVAYGTDALQKMDVYLPAGRTVATTKSLIVIHGGGWALGDKADNNFLIDSMKRRVPTLAIFNINYRLSSFPANPYPASSNDVTAAVNFILSKAAEYKISDKLAIIGLSAGGHLGLYETYKNNSAGKIKAVISAFGPTDLTDMWNNPAGTPATTRFGLSNYIGTTQTLNPAAYVNASPITHASTSSVPTQLFHGTADTLVSINQSVMLRNRLQTLGRTVEYFSYTGEGHGWIGANLIDTLNKIVAFLQQYLQ